MGNQNKMPSCIFHFSLNLSLVLGLGIVFKRTFEVSKKILSLVFDVGVALSALAIPPLTQMHFLASIESSMNTSSPDEIAACSE